MHASGAVTVCLSLLFWCAASAEASAQVVYKCAAKDKPVVFQGQPCAPGTSVVSVREYASAPAAPPASAPGVSMHRTRPAPRLSRRRSTAGQSIAKAAADSCADTKARRDEWERTVGLRRTFDDLRRWNDAVSRACR